MKSTVAKAALASILLGASLMGCATAGAPISQVQTNLVDKSIFEGEWWTTTAIVDVDNDEAMVFGTAGAFAPWNGALPFQDLGVDPGGSFPIARIRWVIDEDTLFAYRANEIVQGGNGGARTPGFRGQPIAAFAITAHVDVRQDYNPVTGELSNVTVENTTDRRWYERQFVRVDWSSNLVASFAPNAAEYAQLFNQMRPEPVAFDFESQAHGLFPDSYKPQFTRVRDDRGYRFYDDWPADNDSQSKVHYMSFVTQEVWSPGGGCLQFGGICASAAVTVRHSFLRVPPNHEYAVETINNEEFDHFGIWQQTGRTYVRGGEERESLMIACQTDANCGIGGYCRELDRNGDGAGDAKVCSGGWTNDYSETDFLTFYRSRHNFYRDSLRDTACRADWECDGRYDVGLTPAELNEKRGSVCDRAARRCTVPLQLRSRYNEDGETSTFDRPGMRQVTYTLNPGFPAYLARSAFQVVGEWNEVFMRGQRAVDGIAAPTGPRLRCQNVDPTQYCYCTAAEVGPDMTCEFKYNPFQTPEQAAAAGVTNPYQCYVRNATTPTPTGALPHEGDVAAPTSYDDYPGAREYQYEFVGPECMFVLNANACDKDPTKACNDLGDLRFQFFNYIENGGAQFGGVAEPISDPETGELIVAPVNMAGESIDAVGTQALRDWPLLRCRQPGQDIFTCEREANNDQFWNGEYTRQYFANLGRVENPVALAPTGNDGYSVTDPTRPGLPTDISSLIRERMNGVQPFVERLQEPGGRHQILSSRMRSLEGTSIESQLLRSMGQEGRDLVSRQYPLQGFNPQQGQILPMRAGTHTPVSAMDPEVANSISPMRGGFLDSLTAEERRQQVLMRLNIDPPRDRSIYFSWFNFWWAEQFRGRPPAEAAIRWRQAYLRGVMLHEVGHSVGLRHNFAASFDRNHFNDGYYSLARKYPLPNFSDYDRVANGGNEDGQIVGQEANRWLADLRTARNARALAGAGNYMESSIMEYPGDYSDMSGLGKYDGGAVFWSYFNRIEAFATDPTLLGCTATGNECGSGTCQIPSGQQRGTCTFRGTLENIAHSDVTDRVLLEYYRGGESCQTDATCPNRADRLTGQPIAQRCIQNPRYTRIPTACRAGTDENCVCSPFREDIKDYVASTPNTAWAPRTCNPTDNTCGTGYACQVINPAAPTMGRCEPQYRGVDYLFCNDERSQDLSWCSTFDVGESFRDAIDNFRRRWQGSYPSAYFRNFQSGGAGGRASVSAIINAAKIYQHLFFRYFYEPGFQGNTGPLGSDDQFLASVDAMNWFIEMATLPDVGAYALDTQDNVYRYVGETAPTPAGGIRLDPGLGFYNWSQYQQGQNGFFRVERRGVFYDRYIALLALAIRDWGFSFFLDERFPINFYDLFPNEMINVFGGLITDNPRRYAPRATGTAAAPGIQYMDFWRTDDNCGPTRDQPCRPAQELVYPEPAIDTSNDVMRSWATILALAQFPVYYDTTFQQRLQVFKLGSGDGYTFPVRRPDGRPTCAYGNPDAVAGCETADPRNAGFTFEHVDFIKFKSERLGFTYVAAVVRPSITYNLKEQQIGYELLVSLQQLQDRVRELAALGSRTPAQEAELRAKRTRLTGGESYLEYLIELQREYGIVPPG